MSFGGSQELNESRFLVEEINLDEQPTEEQILERAEELDIDDLFLAKESLTKELDPHWKPYSNRHGDVYYINLIEGKAYIDHPIDMHFKKLDCQNNGAPPPRYQSFGLGQVSQSLDLIEKEMRNLESQGGTLRVVYEEPSEEELSSHPRSPQNQQSNSNPPHHSPHSGHKQQQLTAAQKTSLLQFRSQLEEHYETEMLDHKRRMAENMEAILREKKRKEEQIVARKVQELKLSYQAELQQKNDHDYQKQKSKMEHQNSQKVEGYYEAMAQFNAVFDQLRERLRNAEGRRKEIDMLHKQSLTQQISSEAVLGRVRAHQKIKDDLLKEFDGKAMEIVGGSSVYQEFLKKQIQEIGVSDGREKPGIFDFPMHSEDGDSPPAPFQSFFKCGQNEHRQNENKQNEDKQDSQKYGKGSSQPRRSRKIFTAAEKASDSSFYSQLQQQIDSDCIWSDQAGTSSTVNKLHYKNAVFEHSSSSRASLNLRLKIRIL